MAVRTFRSSTGHNPSLPPHRLLGLDAARVIATLGVVWFHSVESDALHTSGILGRFSVAFYTMAAMVFLVDSSNRRAAPVADVCHGSPSTVVPAVSRLDAVTVLVLYVLSAWGKRWSYRNFHGTCWLTAGRSIFGMSLSYW